MRILLRGINLPLHTVNRIAGTQHFKILFCTDGFSPIYKVEGSIQMGFFVAKITSDLCSWLRRCFQGQNLCRWSLRRHLAVRRSALCLSQSVVRKEQGGTRIDLELRCWVRRWKLGCSFRNWQSAVSDLDVGLCFDHSYDIVCVAATVSKNSAGANRKR